MSLATNAPALPFEPLLPYPAVIQSIKTEAYGIATFTLKFQQPELAAAYRFKPGQFNMIHIPGCGEVAISIASDPDKPETLEHTIRYAGMVTRAISRLKAGDVLGLRGPYGSSWPLEQCAGKDLLIVTGGIGMAPLRPVILSLMHHREQYGRILLLYGGRTPQDLLYTEEHDAWQQGGIEVHVSVDRADDTWKGQVGVIPMNFYRIRLEAKKTAVLTCGPEIMMRFVIYEAMARRIPKELIFVSMERNMKCAVGFCGHCQYGGTFTCKQGPIYNFKSIEPFFGKEEF